MVHVKPIDTTKQEIRKVKVKEIRRRKDLLLTVSKENTRDLSQSSVLLITALLSVPKKKKRI